MADELSRGWCPMNMEEIGQLGTDRLVWVPNWSSASCDLGVFVYQPAEQIATSQVKRWDGDAGGGSD